MTTDTFDYDRGRGVAVAMIRGSRVEIRAPHAKARQMFDALTRLVDDEGKLRSPPYQIGRRAR